MGLHQLLIVYEITLIVADGALQYYTGMNYRMFKMRMLEHLANIKHDKKITPLARVHIVIYLQNNFKNYK